MFKSALRESCYNLLNEVDFGLVLKQESVVQADWVHIQVKLSDPLINQQRRRLVTAVVATALSYRYMATRTLRSQRMSANPCVWWLPARREAGSRGFKTLRRN